MSHVVAVGGWGSWMLLGVVMMVNGGWWLGLGGWGGRGRGPGARQGGTHSRMSECQGSRVSGVRGWGLVE